MLTPRGTQLGITLIELMVASAIALFALSVVFTVYSATARHSALHLQRAHLHQQLHGVLQLITGDVRRSGYWQFDPLEKSPADNPFQNMINDLRIGAYPGESPGSCILFAYDIDRDGLTGVGRCPGTRCASGNDDDNVEQFGFRLRDGSIQSRYGGPDFTCNSGYWQSVTDPEIAVTRFQLTEHVDCNNLTEPERPCTGNAARLVRRAIELQLAGKQRKYPDIQLNVSGWIRVRNDRLAETTP